MKKQNTSFKLVIGRMFDNDPFMRVMLMEGNEIKQHIYKTLTEDILAANMECLRALAEYSNKKAEEYEDIIKIEIV